MYVCLNSLFVCLSQNVYLHTRVGLVLEMLILAECSLCTDKFRYKWVST